eukprot:scaffold293035_cov18-Tisochrysis_lutea.AAC.1
MEGMVIVLRDIENLLRNQQPVVVHQEARQPVKRRGCGWVHMFARGWTVRWLVCSLQRHAGGWVYRGTLVQAKDI